MPAITVLVEARYLAQSQPSGLVQALRRRGDDVTVVHDQSGDQEWNRSLRGASVVVGRGRSARLIDALQRAEDAGIPTVDSATSVAAVRDKRVMTARLVAARLPIPQTWLGHGSQVHQQLRAEDWHGPLIVKPVFGDNSNGIVVLGDPDELLAMDGDLVVQELIPSDGADLKLYVIGDRIWAVRKASPVSDCTATDLGPTPVTAPMEAVAAACGAAFGLTLYGVDCLDVDGDLVVIEVNDFPNYTFVPGAADLIADHVGSVMAA